MQRHFPKNSTQSYADVYLDCNHSLRTRLVVSGSDKLGGRYHEVAYPSRFIVVLLATPVASFAQQSSMLVTRAEVRAELVQLEQTSWRPGVGSDPYYPDDIQAAEAKVAAQHGATSGLGGVVSGSSQAGGQGGVSAAERNAMYNHP
jgi:Domain of unknown function (DUF4148)